MNKIRLWLAASTGILAIFGCSAATAADRFDIAITVDDLTAHGQLPPGMARQEIAEMHVQTFKAHGVKEAFGFVNAVKIADEPESRKVLQIWRQAGYPLGNHSYSHMSLSRAETLEAWQIDVIAGEAVVIEHMKGADWRYFRYPFLAAGEGMRAASALAFLKGRGYRIADVSVAFSDWNYTDAYARCLAKGDAATIEAMKAQYLKEVEDGIVRMKAVSQRVYGRIIPQVLLTHLGGWSAIMLPEAMDRLDAAGARYVALAEAQSDPAYAVSGGGNIMERAAKAQGINLSDIASPVSSANVKTFCK